MIVAIGTHNKAKINATTEGIRNILPGEPIEIVPQDLKLSTLMYGWN